MKHPTQPPTPGLGGDGRVRGRASHNFNPTHPRLPPNSLHGPWRILLLGGREVYYRRGPPTLKFSGCINICLSVPGRLPGGWNSAVGGWPYNSAGDAESWLSSSRSPGCRNKCREGKSLCCRLAFNIEKGGA